MNTITRRISRIFVALLAMSSVALHAANVDFAALYERVSDSVVTVNTGTMSVTNAGIAMKPGVGSGILIEPQLVMTAAHVVDGVDFVSVKFKDGTTIDAEVMASVEQGDVGLLRLAESHPQPVIATLGDSDAAKTGSDVFIIGAPYGVEQTLSVGILSGRMTRGNLPDGTSIDYLQTDTAINPGNSGGPMFNLDGEVIGIVSFILSNGGGFDGVGYASAINSAYRSVFESTVYISGVDGQQLPDQVRRALGLPETGFLVERVVDGSIADELGLQAGAIPAEIAGQKFTLGGDIIVDISCEICEASISSFDSAVNQLKYSPSAEVTVVRQGETIILSKQPKSIIPEGTTVARLEGWYHGRQSR